MLFPRSSRQTASAKDFLLGDNIQREYALSEYLETERNRILGEIIAKLKSEFGVSSASSKAIDLITSADLKALIKDLANTKSKGGKYKTPRIISIIESLPSVTAPECADDKLAFVIQDISDKNSLIRKIESLAKALRVTICDGDINITYEQMEDLVEYLNNNSEIDRSINFDEVVKKYLPWLRNK